MTANQKTTHPGIDFKIDTIKTKLKFTYSAVTYTDIDLLSVMEQGVN